MIYKNGNTIVEIKSDGTKIRYTPDNKPANPIFPESIDMKICNRCLIDPPCPMCHEQSGPNRKFANLNHPLIDSLSPYTEVAIGGGDPMEHPDLEEFLKKLNQKQFFANITVHWKSFLKNCKRLKYFTENSLIYGLGISINEVVPCEVIDKVSEFKNAVVHCVIGVADEAVYRQIEDRNLNILLLGYKTFGRGLVYRSHNSLDIMNKINWVKENIQDFVNHFRAVSFDNLSIEQLEMKTRLKKDTYDQIYMGEDGSFTMYIDLVEETYAVSSVSKRYNIKSNDIKDLFKSVREMR